MCTLHGFLSRFPAAVPPRPGAAAGELLAGGADDRTHLEVHSLSWQTHLRSGPDTRQVQRNSSQTSALPATFGRFSPLFHYPALTLTHILRVIDQHCRFSISHLASHCAIPTGPFIK